MISKTEHHRFSAFFPGPGHLVHRGLSGNDFHSKVTRSEYVFANSVGNRHDASKLKRAFKKAVDEAGIINFTFHCLRHTYATRLAHLGADILVISKLLCHKDVATTAKYYAHHCLDSLRRAIDMMNVCHNNVTEPGTSQSTGDGEAD